MVNHRHQSVRILLFIQIPVAQSRMVIIASLKPAVVDNETFNAKRCRTSGHLHDVVRVVVKINTFPGIEVHRTGFLLRKTDDFIAQKTVVLLTHTIEPLRGIAGVQPRRVHGLILLQGFFSGHPQCFRLEVTPSVSFDLTFHAMVATPAQMYGPHLALLF